MAPPTTPRIEIDREQVLRLRARHKTWPEIAQLVGCSLRTIKRRAKDWGLTEEGSEAVQEAAHRASTIAQAKWSLRRAEEADEAGLLASRVRQRIAELIDKVGEAVYDDGKLVAVSNGVGLELQRLANVYDRMIGSAQLLSGGPTERTENLSESAIDEEWKALTAELRNNPQGPPEVESTGVATAESTAGGD